MLGSRPQRGEVAGGWENWIVTNCIAWPFTDNYLSDNMDKEAVCGHAACLENIVNAYRKIFGKISKNKTTLNP
jgi:hypothetical protein